MSLLLHEGAPWSGRDRELPEGRSSILSCLHRLAPPNPGAGSTARLSKHRARGVCVFRDSPPWYEMGNRTTPDGPIHSYYPRLAGEEAEAQRGPLTCPGSHS